MMTPQRLVGSTALLLAAISLGFQRGPSLAPDEVRISSRAYQPKISFHSDTQLVQLEVVVRDRKGDAVDGLKKADFVLTDSGKRRELTAYSLEHYSQLTREQLKEPGASEAASSSTPDQRPTDAAKPQPPASLRHIALLFDDLNTSSGDLSHAKIAATRFVKEALKAGDQIGVFTTSAGRVVDFTGKSESILRSFDLIQAHQRVPPGGLAACPRITAFDAYRIVSNDPGVMQAAVARACNCAGDASCGIAQGTPTGEMLTPTSRGANNAYGGAGTQSTLISSVKAQAQQTWDLARVASQATLNGVQFTLGQLAGQPGSRMLLLASSGFLSGSLESEVDDIINQAVRQSVVINSLDSKGLYTEAPEGDFKETDSMTKVPIASVFEDARSLGDKLDSEDSAPAKFAESTGGLMFKNYNDLSLGFYRLGMVPAVSYLLAFPPEEDGKYHKITVKLANKANGQFVQTRPGYQAPLANGKQAAAVDPLDREVSAQDTLQDFGATVETQPASGGDHKLTLQNHVDLQKLPFQHQKDREVEKLTFVAALFDEKGNFVTGKEAEMNLALKPDSFTRLSASGIKAAMSLEAAAGTYRLRTVVQEGVQHKMVASTREVRIQ